MDKTVRRQLRPIRLSIRLTEGGGQIMQQLMDRTGQDPSGLVELAIRQMATRYRVGADGAL